MLNYSSSCFLKSSFLIRYMKKIFIALAAVAVLVSCSSNNGKSGTGGDRNSSEVETIGQSVVKNSGETSSAQDSNDGNELQKPYVVDFYATWCPPCKKLAPIFHEMENRYSDKADFGSIDIDEEQALASSMGIEGVPTIIVFADKSMKQELGRVVGFDPNGIEALIKRYTK